VLDKFVGGSWQDYSFSRVPIPRHPLSAHRETPSWAEHALAVIAGKMEAHAGDEIRCSCLAAEKAEMLRVRMTMVCHGGGVRSNCPATATARHSVHGVSSGCIMYTTDTNSIRTLAASMQHKFLHALPLVILVMCSSALTLAATIGAYNVQAINL